MRCKISCTCFWSDVEDDYVWYYYIYDFMQNSFQVTKSILTEFDLWDSLPSHIVDTFNAKFQMASRNIFSSEGKEVIGVDLYHVPNVVTYLGLFENEFYLILELPRIDSWNVLSADGGFSSYMLHHGRNGRMHICVKCSVELAAMINADNDLKLEVLSHMCFKVALGSVKHGEKIPVSSLGGI